MKKKNVRQQLIDSILLRNGDEDNQQERAFLETLPTVDLEALARQDDDLESPNFEL